MSGRQVVSINLLATLPHWGSQVNVLESACISFVVQKRGIDREGRGRRKDGATERENESN